jgi:hypothetical protein
MSETISFERLLKNVSESGLPAAVDLRATLDGLRAGARVTTATDLALGLADAGRLTSI